MDFELSSEQQLLADSVVAFGRRESPPSRLRALRSDATGYSPALLGKMAELGWTAIPFAESVGGLAQSFFDVSLVLQGLGATLVPEPFIPQVVLAGMTLALSGDEAAAEKWLPSLISTETRFALAYAESSSRYDVALTATRAAKVGDAWRIDGDKRFVLAGHAADKLLVVARTAGAPGDVDGLTVFVVDADAAGVTRGTVDLIDGHRAAMVSLRGVTVGDDRVVGAVGGAHGFVEHALDHAAAAACAEGVGIMRASLEMTTEYLRTRVQFGAPIGSFQALQHRAVDMFVETELMSSMSILANLAVSDADPGARRAAVSAAKVQLEHGGRFVTQQAIQLHGGIGITDEHDIGLYFKRMQALISLFGDAAHHAARFAAQPSFLAGVTPEAT